MSPCGGQPVELVEHGAQRQRHVVARVTVGDREDVEVVDLLAPRLEMRQRALDDGAEPDQARIGHGAAPSASALVTLPAFRQRVQTYTRRGAAPRGCAPSAGSGRTAAWWRPSSASGTGRRRGACRRCDILGHAAGKHSAGRSLGYASQACRPSSTVASPCPIATGSSATSPTAGWPPSGRPRTSSSAAPSRSRSSPPTWPRTSAHAGASSARRAPPPALSNHPNVVTIYDVGEHDGRTFMVMELFSGGTAADRLRAGDRIPPETALRWLREAAEALDAAHDAASSTATSSPPTCCSTSAAAWPGRLRDRPPGARGPADADRAGPRHRRLHLARAGVGDAGDRRLATATRSPSSPSSC